jgi:hypothetical protein
MKTLLTTTLLTLSTIALSFCFVVGFLLALVIGCPTYLLMPAAVAWALYGAINYLAR